MITVFGPIWRPNSRRGASRYLAAAMTSLIREPTTRDGHLGWDVPQRAQIRNVYRLVETPGTLCYLSSFQARKHHLLQLIAVYLMEVVLIVESLVLEDLLKRSCLVLGSSSLASLIPVLLRH